MLHGEGGRLQNESHCEGSGLVQCHYVELSTTTTVQLLKTFVALHVFLVQIILSHDKLWGLPRRVFTLFQMGLCKMTPQSKLQLDYPQMLTDLKKSLTCVGYFHLQDAGLWRNFFKIWGNLFLIKIHGVPNI